MNYSIMIAAAFILATIAVAALSPFDHLPQGAPQQTAAAGPEIVRRRFVRQLVL